MGKNKNKNKATEGKETPAAPTPIQKLGRRDQAIRFLNLYATRVASMGKNVADLLRGSPVTDLIENATKKAVAELEAASKNAATLPVDWKPVRANNNTLEEGTLVRVREKYADTWAGLLPTNADLKVKDVRQAVVGVETPNGTVYVPRGNLIRADRLGVEA